MVLTQIRNLPTWEVPGTLRPSTLLSLGAREIGTSLQGQIVSSQLQGQKRD